MEENLIKVYVKVDTNNVIININSDIFIKDTENWIQIDKGRGDRFAHAQTNYLENGIYDSDGYNYKLVNNKLVELTAAEKKTLFSGTTPAPTQIDLLAAQLLETQTTLADLQIKFLMINGGM